MTDKSTLAKEFEPYIFGNEILDRDHWALFQILDESMNASTLVEVQSLLSVLLVHWGTHSKNEMQIMVQIDYPHMIEHTREHVAILGSLHEMKLDLSKHTENVALSDSDHIGLIGNIANMMIGHMNTSDRKFVEFINLYLTHSDEL